jgi:prophage regulatory protein
MLKTLPETGFLRLAQVLQFIPVCKATFWNGVKTGRYPKPFKNGRCTFWRVEDIKKLIEQIGGGDSK